MTTRTKNTKRSPEQKRRLRQWAAWMSKLNPKFLDMDSFTTRSCGKKAAKFFKKVAADQSKNYQNCGTTCCAVGWLPEAFPEQFHRGEDGGFYASTMKDQGGLAFFGITTSESVMIWTDQGYRSSLNGKTKPKDVARRLRRLASGKSL